MAGGNDIIFYPIKNMQLGKDIVSVIQCNFPYFKDFSVYDDNEKIVHNNDCISNKCIYHVRRGSVVTLSRTATLSSHPVRKKRYWYR